MEIIKLILALGLLGVSIVCTIIILIDMLRNEIWKGLVGLICGLYLLYYALFEFEHDSKWLIVIGSVFGSSAAALILR